MMKLLRDRRGVAAILFGLAAVPLMLAIGIGVDAMRIWLVRSRLITAVDAAALAGARNLNVTDTQRNAEIRAMFWTNFRRTSSTGPGPWVGFMGSDAPNPEICARPGCNEVDSNTIRVSNAARVPLTFMRLTRMIGGPNNDYATVRWSADARRADLGMEVSLVLDVTGSMGTNLTPSPFGSTTTNGTNIDALRLAAGDLVSILYGSNESLPNLRVAVVPYTTTVNIGTARTNWLDPGRPSDARYSPVTWRGCVDVRHTGGNDQNDATPSAAPFMPFFYPSTARKYTRTSNGAVVPGDNDWDPTLTGNYAISEMYQDERENYARGPNVGCPQVPILPLTASKTTVLNTIAAVRSTFRGGTMHNVGLQAGWFTLSPNWRGLWGDATYPLAYGTPFMQKVVVLMTDGVAGWHDWPGGAPGECTYTTTSTARIPAGGPLLFPFACPVAASYPSDITVASGAPPLSSAGVQNADYSGYGRPLENRLGIAPPYNATRTTAELNTRFSNLCRDMKARGVIIYTITFNLTSTTTQNLFRTCATVPENYFNSPTQATLRTAFQQIGTQLANLRLLK